MSKQKYLSLFERINELEETTVDARLFHNKLKSVKNELTNVQKKRLRFFVNLSDIEKKITLLESYQIELDKLLSNKKEINEEQARIDKIIKEFKYTKIAEVDQEIDQLLGFVNSKQTTWRTEIYETGLQCKTSNELDFERIKLSNLRSNISYFKNGLAELKTAYKNITEIGINGDQEDDFYQAVCYFHQIFFQIFDQDVLNNDQFSEWLEEIQAKIKDLEPFVAKKPPETLEQFYEIIRCLRDWKQRWKKIKPEFTEQIKDLIDFKKRSLSQNWRKLDETELNKKKEESSILEQKIIINAEDERREKLKYFQQKITDLKCISSSHVINNIEKIDKGLNELTTTIKTDKSAKHRLWLQNFEKYESDFGGLITNNTYDIRQTLERSIDGLKQKITKLRSILLPIDTIKAIELLEQEINIQKESDDPNQMLDFILTIKNHDHALITYQTEADGINLQLKQSQQALKNRLEKLQEYTDNIQIEQLLEEITTVETKTNLFGEAQQDYDQIKNQIEQLENEIIGHCYLEYQTLQHNIIDKQTLLNEVDETKNRAINHIIAQFGTIQEMMDALDKSRIELVVLEDDIETMFQKIEQDHIQLIQSFKSVNHASLSTHDQDYIVNSIENLEAFNKQNYESTTAALTALYPLILEYQETLSAINSEQEIYHHLLKTLQTKLVDYNRQNLGPFATESYYKIIGFIQGLPENPRNLSLSQTQCRQITKEFELIEIYTKRLASEDATYKIKALQEHLSFLPEAEQATLTLSTLLNKISANYSQTNFLPANIRLQLRAAYDKYI